MQNYLETKFKNKKVLILGWAREGRSTFEVLKRYLPDLAVAIADQDENAIIDNKNIKRFFGPEYLDHLKEFDVVIKSPGISGLNNKILEAQKYGVEVTSQTKIFFDVCLGKIIGVTGTKGKSTTSSLIFEMLKNADLNVSLVGNIGKPVLDNLGENDPSKIYVFELSSHQLFDLEKSPTIAIVTNIGVDHLDWYRNLENYIDAKTHILKYQNEGDIAILNYDNLITRGFDRFGNGAKFFTSKTSKQNGAYVADSVMYLADGSEYLELGKVSDLKLIGQHSWDNVMMAALAAKSVGVKNDIIWKTACDFSPLEHHLEFVKAVNDIVFYNDSFAVDQIATLAAINSFKENMTLVLGGFDRGIDYTEIATEIAKKNNINTIILIGQVADKMASLLTKSKYSGRVIKLEKTNMGNIVKTAYKHTSPGGIVLFSPAAASFDMFKDYKDRGEQFKKSVNDLK